MGGVKGDVCVTGGKAERLTCSQHECPQARPRGQGAV